jgi:hypothetical protein
MLSNEERVRTVRALAHWYFGRIDGGTDKGCGGGECSRGVGEEGGRCVCVGTRDGEAVCDFKCDGMFDGGVGVIGRDGVAQLAQVVGGYLLGSVLINVAEIKVPAS